MLGVLREHASGLVTQLVQPLGLELKSRRSHQHLRTRAGRGGGRREHCLKSASRVIPLPCHHFCNHPGCWASSCPHLLCARRVYFGTVGAEQLLGLVLEDSEALCNGQSYLLTNS